MTIRNTEINEKSLATVEFSFSAEEIENAKKNVYRKKVGTFNVPGFRRGKAPRNIIEKMYGTGIFLEDAINELLDANYAEILTAAGENIVARPDFDIVSEDDGVVMTAKIQLKPTATIEGYKGLEISVVRPPVSDEEVDREIQTVRERNARETEIEDRAAAMGDIAVIDYEGFVDGVAFEGGKDEGHHLKLGSGQFIPGFEEGVVGKNKGEEFDVNVTFPTDYHAEDLAGKEAVFKVKLNSIIFEELPELDDEFATEVSEFNTFAEYRADVVAKIEKRHADAAANDVKDKVCDALAEKVVVELPECMIDSEVENMVRDGESRMQMQGLDFNTYLKYFGMTLDQYKEQVRPSAEKRVRNDLALEAIAKLEAIEISDEDVETEYAEIAKNYNVEVDYAKENLPASEIRYSLTMRRALDLVTGAAAVTYLESAPEEEAAKDAE